METGGLKSFAGEARRQLLSEVRARLELVLAGGSTQRREYADVVRKLESAVDEAGGGEAGRVAVVDRVAYTWFNRIVALRFMDANGFTDVGVVSPAADRPDGQPEVLVEAKRGVIDTDVVAPADAQRVAGLLNGSVTSADPESEAFGLLLAAYCRFWNKSMPFMFEHSADYTELLMPADLLSDESIIASAASVLTTDVCADVEVIGWLYQFYIAERKDEVFAGFRKGKKAGAAEIPAATQLFTPDWIVRYLVENSLGRLWLLNRPDSALAEVMDYYIDPVDEEMDFLRIESPEEIKVMDPACGSGHMLTYAFDVLFAMYEEDGYNPTDIPALILSKNLYGTEIDRRAGSLAAFALTMKARARQRTLFSRHVTPNICVLEPVTFTADELNHLVSADGDRDAEAAFFTMFSDADTRGALIRPDESLLPAMKARVESLCDGDTLFNQDLIGRARQVVKQAGYLTSRYHVVVANPPYMGAGNMGNALSDYARTSWQLSGNDLFAMFVERGLELVVPGGSLAFITMQSWMFLRAFETFRRTVLSRHTLMSLVHLGTNAFDQIPGEVVSTVAFVAQRGTRRARDAVFVDARDGRSEAQKSDVLLRVAQQPEKLAYFVDPKEFLQIPGSPLAYWLGSRSRQLFSTLRPLAEFGSAAVGMATGDNGRFVRRWFEVSFDRIGFGMTRREARDSGRAWFPYAKGGENRRWFTMGLDVVYWQNDGEVLQTEKHSSGRIRAHNFNLDRIFNEGISWATVSGAQPWFRFTPAGQLFDSSAGSFQSVTTDLRLVLGYLNSRVAQRLLAALNPTVNTPPNYLEALPFVVPSTSDQVVALVDLAVETCRSAVSQDERSYDFGVPGWVSDSTDTSSVRVADAWESAEASRITMSRYLGELERGIEDLWMRELKVEGELDRRANADVTELPGAPPIDFVSGLVSYAVGCMFGRYSLDEPGLILANEGATLKEYLVRIPEPSFMPDEDNVIPVLADDWFDDDIVERFRLFLRTAFGEEHFEENLRFVEESLGKDIRKYFLTDFYKDHVQRYKKRPIYWMFSSPKGTFNALIYMHRYNSSTVSTVLNEYLREFQAKLDAELANQARIAADLSASARDKARAEKESDKIRKMLAELKDYEHDVLYPLASRQISIDLDDGVKSNYPKFGAALKKIPGLEATND